MNKVSTWIVAAALCAGTVVAESAPDPYRFDRVHTQILFFVEHLGFSKSQGEFLDFDGGFAFDPNDWESATVDITIRTHSIDMDDHEWDKHLRGEDFFKVAEFPTMRFRGTRFEKAGDKQGLLHGDLTLLGVTRPVTLAVTFNRIGTHPLKKYIAAGFSATATVKRSDFGMSYGIPMIGDEVEVRLEI